MTRNYTVRNLSDKLNAQRLNGIISASRRVTLTAENLEAVRKLSGGQTVTDFVNSLVRDWTERKHVQHNRT